MPPQYSVSPNSRVPFNLAYADEHFVILDKPASVVTQPGEKHRHDTLLNGAFERWGKQLQNLGKKRDFGLLHRLDRGTSGLVVIALTAEAYDGLRALFESRSISKTYWALVSGQSAEPSGLCSIPIAEKRIKGSKRAILIRDSPIYPQQKANTRKFANSHPGQRRKSDKRYPSNNHRSFATPSHQNRDTDLRAQNARTAYQVLEVHQSDLGPISFVECRPSTGRLHQIRVHMRSLGMTVIGDFDYGGNSEVNKTLKALGRDRLMLHAGRLDFEHPITRERLIVEAGIPQWWSMLSDRLQLPSAWVLS